MVQAIHERKARGFEVTLYPFLMMDIPAGNPCRTPIRTAPEAGQPAFPGAAASPAPRLRASPAAGQDRRPPPRRSRSSLAAPPPTISMSLARRPAGPVRPATRACGGDPALRPPRAAAGGVDAFLIGSELGGLTQVRSGAGPIQRFSSCAILRLTAARSSAPARRSPMPPTGRSISGTARRRQRRPLLPPRPALGRRGNRLHRHRRLLAALGLARRRRPCRCAAGCPRSTSATTCGGTSREASFDWFDAERRARGAGSHADQRRPRLALGLPVQGSPRLVAEPALQPARWDRKRHTDRLDAREQADPLHRGRLPGDRQGREPAERLLRPEILGVLRPVFLARLSRRSIQRRYIEALLTYWADRANNPASGVFRADDRRGRDQHLDLGRAPFPAFPARADVWQDNANWQLGHWLTGRLGATGLAELVRELCRRGGFPEGLVDTPPHRGRAGLHGDRAGKRARVDRTAGAVLRLRGVETGGQLRFVPRGGRPVAKIEPGELVAAEQREAEDIPPSRAVRKPNCRGR